jgi:putative oxidoreductase
MNDRALRFLSFGLGFLLLFHGLDKIMHGTAFVEKMLLAQKIPYSEYAQYGVYVGEVLAPLFLILGKYVRVAGAVVALNMLIAIFLVHQKTLFTLGEHGAWSIELPMLYLIMALSVVLWHVETKAKS